MTNPKKERFSARYDRMTAKASSTVIGSYSTSFYLATRLLGPRERRDIRNLYAMVRIADEIVDGAAAQAGVPTGDLEGLLDDYERAVLAAPTQLFNADPVLHAYGQTARRCGLRDDYVRAFFRSMRRDLGEGMHDRASFATYIYGSAEVIGLMCVDIFLADHRVSAADRDMMDTGARALGAAFQKINFLRDFAEDTGQLGRTYFGEQTATALTEDRKNSILDECEADLNCARLSIPLLPRRARTGVLAATELFAALATRLRATPASVVATTRIRVPPALKLTVVARAMVQAAAMGPGVAAD